MSAVQLVALVAGPGAEVVQVGELNPLRIGGVFQTKEGCQLGEAGDCAESAPSGDGVGCGDGGADRVDRWRVEAEEIPGLGRVAGEDRSLLLTDVDAAAQGHDVGVWS